MTFDMILFLTLTLVAGGMFWLAHPRWTTLIGIAVVCSALYFITPEILGRGLPTENISKVSVLMYVLEEPRAIHLWVMRDKPRYLILPWDEELAKSLQGAAREKKAGKLKAYGIEGKKGKYIVTKKLLHFPRKPGQ